MLPKIHSFVTLAIFSSSLNAANDTSSLINHSDLLSSVILISSPKSQPVL